MHADDKLEMARKAQNSLNLYAENRALFTAERGGGEEKINGSHVVMTMAATTGGGAELWEDTRDERISGVLNHLSVTRL